MESTGKFNLPYSKFASNSGVSPRLGMFLIYFFPILGYSFTISSEKLKHLPVILLTGAVIVHFAKRCLESLFLHIYSGKIGILAVILISFAYTNICILIASKTNQLSSDFLSKVPTPQLVFGCLLFAVGELGNLWHHILLRNLRSTSQTKTYQMPQGGLFPYLVCPHYTLEIIAWIGIAYLSAHWETFALTLVMVLYLAGRSIQTQTWYLQKIEGFPKNRKRLLPFVF